MRVAAIGALEKRTTSSSLEISIETLIIISNDENKFVRTAVLKALDGYKKLASISKLISALHDPQWNVCMEAVQAQSIFGEQIEQITQHLFSRASKKNLAQLFKKSI